VRTVQSSPLSETFRFHICTMPNLLRELFQVRRISPSFDAFAPLFLSVVSVHHSRPSRSKSSIRASFECFDLPFPSSFLSVVSVHHSRPSRSKSSIRASFECFDLPFPSSFLSVVSVHQSCPSSSKRSVASVNRLSVSLHHSCSSFQFSIPLHPVRASTSFGNCQLRGLNPTPWAIKQKKKPPNVRYVA
jgi:hypothetical protein